MAYFKYLNKNIYYEVNGEGEPLIILNGIMMSTKSWEVFKDEFARDFMFIRVDFLDQGQSDAMDEAYTQDLQVELLRELLNELSIKKVNLVGISYGGEVALAFACKYQELVAKLIVFNAVSHTDEVLKKTGHLWNKYASNRDYQGYYQQTIPVIYSDAFINNNLEWMQKRQEMLLKGPFSNHEFLDKMIRLTNSAESFDLRSKLGKLAIPVLIVGASEDKLTPITGQTQLHRTIPSSRLIILPGVGHASMYEVPEIFVALVIGYVKINKYKYVI